MWIRIRNTAIKTHHGAEGNGPAGMVVDGDEVDGEGGAAHHGGQQEGGGQHLPHPHLAPHPGQPHLKVIYFKSVS
jgi:hypothetical protein